MTSISRPLHAPNHSTCPPEETATATTRSVFEIARLCSVPRPREKMPALGAVSLAHQTADKAAILLAHVNKGDQPLTRRSHTMGCTQPRPLLIVGEHQRANAGETSLISWLAGYARGAMFRRFRAKAQESSRLATRR